MNLLSCHQLYQESLNSIYSPDEIRHLFKSLLAGFFGWESTVLGLDSQRILSHSDLERMMKALHDLKQDCPFCNTFIGHTYFRGLCIEVTEATLIPRPETEELVEWVLANANDQTQKVLDVGTGSGCIALAIKHAQALLGN